MGHKCEPSGGQIVKRFIKLSCWISSSNANSLRGPNGTQKLILFNFIIRDFLTPCIPCHGDYPLDYDSILETRGPMVL